MTKEETIATCERIFAAHLGGHALMSNAAHLRGSAVWMNFPRVICEKWYHENVVLMGDAAATAHFSIGSGSRLALDSAIALADLLHREPTMQDAFRRYQDERRLEVLRLQSAARNSLEWFEQVERYLDMPPQQFAYSLLTRSQRISHENLRLRDPDWLRQAEDWFQLRAGARRAAPDVRALPPARHGPRQPHRRLAHGAIQGGRRLPDGLALRPLRRAGERGGGPRLYRDDLRQPRGPHHAGVPRSLRAGPRGRLEAARRFRACRDAGQDLLQIGHSGRKGSTQLGWEQMDAPLPSGNWPVLSASALPWSVANPVPKAMDRADMDRVRDEFVAATRMAARCGFDMIELHAAHGYLISSFISPKSNIRADEYGGSLENRMRYPLEVLTAMRAAWPAAKPLSVRISATDWLGDEGVTPSEAVQIARLFAAAGPTSSMSRRGRPRPRRVRSMADVPDAVLGSHPQRGGARHDGGGQHHRARPCELHPLGGRADLVCSPVRTWPIPTGRCTPRCAWATGA